MKYVLGKLVATGNKILLNGEWIEVLETNENGVVLMNGKVLAFGDSIDGWKA